MSSISNVLKEKPAGRVIFFVKIPERGSVKTRLAASLGSNVAVTLYKAFVSDILDMLKKGGYPLSVAFCPGHKREKAEKWLGSDFHLMPQRGESLGERMKNAFDEVFGADTEKSLIIGSDTPDLPCAFMDEAFLALRENDVVIGPSVDGGYYLIGFRKESFCPALFEGISWSTSDVLNQTLSRCADRNLRVHLLPRLRDIDTFDDLRIYFRENVNADLSGSMTMNYLRKREENLL